MSPPIIFFHQGFDPYMAFTLWQARQTNPGSPIYLLGDGANDLNSIGVNHVHFRDHPGRSVEFIAAYRHLSGHELECERLCFERWFHLDAFLAKTGIEEFYFLDSDYFLLMDLDEARKDWSPCEMAGAPAWAFSYFKHRDIVKNFCDFTIRSFQDKPLFEAWEKTYRAGSDLFPPAGIMNASDMLLWLLFIRQSGLAHLDLRIPRAGVVFDDVIDGANGFRMRHGFKQLTRRNEMFFGHYEKTGEPVRFAGLHLGGKYPKRLGPLFTGWRLPLLRSCWRPNHRRNLRKLFLIAQYSWRMRKNFFAPSPS
jgi:hypothetical protein